MLDITNKQKIKLDSYVLTNTPFFSFICSDVSVHWRSCIKSFMLGGNCQGEGMGGRSRFFFIDKKKISKGRGSTVKPVKPFLKDFVALCFSFGSL